MELRFVPKRIGLGGGVLDRGPSLVGFLPVILGLRATSETCVRIRRRRIGFYDLFEDLVRLFVVARGLQGLGVDRQRTSQILDRDFACRSHLGKALVRGRGQLRVGEVGLLIVVIFGRLRRLPELDSESLDKILLGSVALGALDQCGNVGINFVIAAEKTIQRRDAPIDYVLENFPLIIG